MDIAERREVLEAIARDPAAYPRDRIAAIRALEELGEERPSATSDLYELTPRSRSRRVRRKAADSGGHAS
jgi:hypothetical protein